MLSKVLTIGLLFIAHTISAQSDLEVLEKSPRYHEWIGLENDVRTLYISRSIPKSKGNPSHSRK